MATRLLAEHFGPQGKPKHPYATREQALREVNRHPSRAMSTYVCPVCSAWHVGRTPKPAGEPRGKRARRKAEKARRRSMAW
jgi:hypothetical protein